MQRCFQTPDLYPDFPGHEIEEVLLNWIDMGYGGIGLEAASCTPPEVAVTVREVFEGGIRPLGEGRRLSPLVRFLGKTPKILPVASTKRKLSGSCPGWRRETSCARVLAALTAGRYEESHGHWI
jgi:hypothetical protein